MKNSENLSHQFEPVFNENSKILILGTFPSVKSRETNFYYGHPQNRFWKVLSALLNVTVPDNIDEKKRMLLEHDIAIWDVIQSCDIVGSSDSSIKNVVPNDLSKIFNSSNIKAVYANGNTAKKLYEKYAEPDFRYKIIGLPSTSPANAAASLEKLIEIWQQILVPLSRS